MTTITTTPYQQFEIDPVVQARELAELKQDLKQSLAEIEEQERSMEQAQKPKTLDEVRELEGRLEIALREVEEMKRAFEKKK